jgi:uncharacterized protein (DUF1810 family)
MNSSPAPAHDLERFLLVPESTIETALEELRAGCKESHWMWFVFPQLAGLGRSEMARRYAITSLAEAEAFLNHPVLGPRLRECTQAALDSGESLANIFPYPDDMKFHSCMTLFLEASWGGEPFGAALRSFFRNQPDGETLSILANPRRAI